MAPIHMLTAGLGSKEWEKASLRLEHQAIRSNWFASVKRYDQVRLDSEIPDFSMENEEFVKRSPRGFGYWLWRAYIIRKELVQAEAGSVILFLDAGCELNVNALSSRRIVEYSEMAIRNGLLLMQTDFLLTAWCKSDTFTLFDVPRDSNLRTLEPGVFFLAAIPENIRLMDEWISISRLDDYHHLDDSPSLIPALSSFREHRHDQAILTCLLRFRPEVAIAQETFFPWDSRGNPGRNFPIWVVRNKSSFVTVSASPAHRVLYRTNRKARKMARKFLNKCKLS